jgi:glycosyltransferase involved in cell wall biosynthesis
MANVLLNALASTAGGGITYLRNVLPRLSESHDLNRYFVLVPAGHLNHFSGFATERLSVETAEISGGSLGRLLWEQTVLRSHINTRNINVLVSLGNFALFASPAPQILFNRNDLYFSDYFERDLKDRGLYPGLISHRLKSLLARYSIKHADINVTPTKAFADRIRRHNGLGDSDFEVLHFGFDAHLFTANDEALPAEQLDKLDLGDDCYRLLYVSHYNYFRNFETLIRALPIIKRQIKEGTGKKVQLVLTTDIRRGAIYGDYDATLAADLIERLGVRNDIAMLGSLPYDKLHRIYRLCDLFVCPSYSESFGHPLVEAMAMGLPVAAANLDVHREICGEASVYFDVFDGQDLAKQCVRVLADCQLRKAMKASGSERSRLFSWDNHVHGLVALIERLSSIRQS